MAEINQISEDLLNKYLTDPTLESLTESELDTILQVDFDKVDVKGKSGKQKVSDVINKVAPTRKALIDQGFDTQGFRDQTLRGVVGAFDLLDFPRRSAGQLTTDEPIESQESAFLKPLSDKVEKFIKEKYPTMGPRTTPGPVPPNKEQVAALTQFVLEDILSDPTLIGGLIAKLGKQGVLGLNKIAKTGISKATAIKEEALEKASRMPRNVIEEAAGTEEEIAEELAQKLAPSKRGRNIFDAKEAKVGELVEDIKVPFTGQPSQKFDVVDDVVKATGESIPKPREIFQQAVDEVEARATTPEFRRIAKSLKNRQETFLESTDELVMGKRANEIKKEWQDILDDAYGTEGKGISKIEEKYMKGIAASIKSSIEEAAANTGRPQFVKRMRSIAKKKEAVKKIGGRLLGDTNVNLENVRLFDGTLEPKIIERARKEISKIDKINESGILRDLEYLDKLFLEATGVPSNFADRARIAAVARQLAVEKGKSIPLASALNNGKSVQGVVLGAALGGVLGGGTGAASSEGGGGIASGSGLGMFVGAMLATPRGARKAFQAMNFADKVVKNNKANFMAEAMIRSGSVPSTGSFEDFIGSFAESNPTGNQNQNHGPQQALPSQP